MTAKIRMALIATYPKLAEVFLNLTGARNNISSSNVYASFEEAAKIAREMEDDLDIILSRGATAEYIRKAVHIPVLSIPITPFDVIKAIHALDPLPKSIALIQYKKNVRDVQEIADMFGISIKEYTFLRRTDIRNAVADAASLGIKTIIGGHVAVETAISFGLNAVELSAGEEAMDRSINEAISMLRELDQVQRNNIYTRHALNSMTEGIVITDHEKRIITINKAAESLFTGKYRKGEMAGPEILSKQCLAAYASKKESPVYIQRIRKETYSITHTPIFRGSGFLGIVNRYENITRTEALEQTIRKEMKAKGFQAQYKFSDILTEDAGMELIKQQAIVYAQTDSAILIQGESGTGKELFAQSIHNQSSRHSCPFVAVNCAAIPPSLLESELFGYEKGAFTGAQKDGKAGFFELAHMGTLFLDEIGEVSPEVQTRLLRVLQEREIMRVGGDKIIPVNVRIISATNRNLKEEVEKGNFRQDLYYRLNILSLSIPPLRERSGDVKLLSGAFAASYQIEKEEIEPLLPLLCKYSWPGNIRELHNIIERFCVLYPFLKKGTFSDEAMHHALCISDRDTKSEPPVSVPSMTETEEPSQDSRGNLVLHIPEGSYLSDIVSHVEYKVIRHALDLYDNDQDAAAKALGIGRTTLWRKGKEDPLNK